MKQHKNQFSNEFQMQNPHFNASITMFGIEEENINYEVREEIDKIPDNIDQFFNSHHSNSDFQ